MTNGNTVERICQAAIRTGTRDGLLAMTIDNVAKEAGVSKGGVMYHFPTKESLMTATLTYYSDLAEQMLMRRISCDPQPRMRWARAMLECVFPDPNAPERAFEGDEEMHPEIIPRFMLAVLAAAVNNPGLIEPLRKLGTRLRERLMNDPEDGLDQLMVWLAVDGLFLWQFVGMIDQSDPVYRQIGESLRARVAVGMMTSPSSDKSASTIARGRKKAPL
ncbi:TetR/AcrR family transcriptional regulator [Schlesneria paludicola]|uniref:TetR/AcrR family transcriptional regulator n=1 Tax=Schlesneria paludicola TaxID=360056 RepID=UPI00029B0E1F|nr:TetR/AcrR family transcriptional regulator [Schlesneria paludicola]